MTAYITEFILPVWVVSEVLIQAYRFAKADSNWILSSMALSFAMCIFFFAALYYSLKKYVRLKPFENIMQSIMTAAYVVVLWFPLAIFIIFKIIFKENTLDWGKTKHGADKNAGTLKAPDEKDGQEACV